jgi:hypothetical protein
VRGLPPAVSIEAKMASTSAGATSAAGRSPIAAMIRPAILSSGSASKVRWSDSVDGFAPRTRSSQSRYSYTT